MKRIFIPLVLVLASQVAFSQIINPNSIKASGSSSGIGIDYGYSFSIKNFSLEPHLAALWVEANHFAGLIGVRLFPFNAEAKNSYIELDYSLCEYIDPANGINNPMQNVSLFIGYKWSLNRFSINAGLGGRYRAWKPFDTYWFDEIMFDFNLALGFLF